MAKDLFAHMLLLERELARQGCGIGFKRPLVSVEPFCPARGQAGGVPVFPGLIYCNARQMPLYTKCIPAHHLAAS